MTLGSEISHFFENTKKAAFRNHIFKSLANLSLKSHVYPEKLQRWPCGAENEAFDIIKVSPHEPRDLWVVNVEGHGFVALIGLDNPKEALDILSHVEFTKD